MIAEGQFLMAANAVWSYVLWLNYSQIGLSRNIFFLLYIFYHIYILATISLLFFPQMLTQIIIRVYILLAILI